jgi:DNA-binding NarL/FixJ family response regulator
MKRRIFIVDDHPLVREGLTNLINRQPDLEVCGEAETNQSARETVAAARPDAVVVDILLRDSSGMELIKELKASSPGVPIIVLSMHDESLYAERALRAGASGYIMKREASGKVVVALRQVIEGKLFVSEHVASAIAERIAAGRNPADATGIESLSDREMEVFELLGEGRGTRQIAGVLQISVKTVQAYCARIKEKLHLTSATELLREAVRYNDRREQAS